MTTEKFGRLKMKKNKICKNCDLLVPGRRV